MVNMLNGWKAPSFAGSNKSSAEDTTNPASILSEAALLRDGDSGSSPREQQIGLSEEDLRRQYQYTPSLQDKFQRLRDKDFARLDEQNCVYLDYTGAALAPKRLVEEHSQMLQSTVLGNPHSQNAPSLAATQLDTEARRAVLEFFHANDDYEVIWTANASAALRVVGESYPFASSSSSHDDDADNAAFLYAPDCHNSVNGIFQYATRHQARTGGFRFRHDHSLNYDWSSFVQQIAAMDHHGKGSSSHNNNNNNNSNENNKLLALPGESNASGLKHNVRRYVDYAHAHGWDVLVDAAAMAPTNPIDLQALGLPEFVTVSFYKIFGYPTGIGCLLAKRSALRKLHKPWFSGGTVRYVGLSSHTIVPLEYEPSHHEQYEDGTINFQATGAVTAGLRYMREEVGMEDLERHVGFLSALTECKLRELTWDIDAGGCAPLVYIPPNPNDDGDDQRGHALPVVFLTRNGELLHHKIVERILSARGIAVRTGCFCNPGSSQQILMDHFDTFDKSMDKFVDHHLRFLQAQGRLDEMVKEGASQGYVRISFGIPTNTDDIDKLITCVKEDILSKPDEMVARMKQWKEKPDIPYSLC